MATNYSPETKHILKWLENNVKDYVTYDDAKIMPAMRAGFDVKRFMRDVKKEIVKMNSVMRTEKEINALRDRCNEFIEAEGSDEYTEGVKAALDWIEGGSNPIE